MSDFIKKVEFKKSVFDKDELPEDIRNNILIIGRSNVGKSSFINKVLNRKKLAFTSKTPGRTQSLNFYLINDKFYFVDFPGYGYGKVSRKLKKKWDNLVNYYLNFYPSKKYAFILIDIRRRVEEDDKEIIEYLKDLYIPVYFILTKADKIGKSYLGGAIDRFKKELQTDYDYIIPFSSLKGWGRDKVINILKKVIE